MYGGELYFVENHDWLQVNYWLHQLKNCITGFINFQTCKQKTLNPYNMKTDKGSSLLQGVVTSRSRLDNA